MMPLVKDFAFNKDLGTSRSDLQRKAHGKYAISA